MEYPDSSTSKKKFFFVASVSLYFAGVVPALAIVDMQNGNYSNTWTDYEDNNIKIARSYNSRTIFDGLFGSGWCSDFETTLMRGADGSLTIINCGAGEEQHYTPKPSEFGRSWERISGGKYVINLVDGIYIMQPVMVDKNPGMGADIYYEFDQTGRLQAFKQKGNIIRLHRNENRIQSVDAKGLTFVLYYTLSGKISSIISSRGAKLTYSYGPGGLLEAVKNAWGDEYHFAYDQYFNLLRAIWPDGTYIRLRYDTKHDWVTEFTDRIGCTENYKYIDKMNRNVVHYISMVTKTCNNNGMGAVSRAFYEFVSDNGSLQRIRTWSSSTLELTDVQYGAVQSVKSKNVYKITEEPQPLVDD